MNASRRQVYGILIVVAVASNVGRLLSAQLLAEPSIHRNEGEAVSVERPRVWPRSVPRPMPTFGSNDRSRWATVRALVDECTFVVGRRDPQLILRSSVLAIGQLDAIQAVASARIGHEFRTKRADSGIIVEPGYETIDKVLHPTKLEWHSSKPPLLSLFIAAWYWLVQALTGWTLAEHPFGVVRLILLLVNIAPFAIYLAYVARLVERYATTDWARYFVVAAAAFGTMVTPFQITLNNHTIATYSVLFALGCLLEIFDHVAAPFRVRTTDEDVVRTLKGAATVQPSWWLFVGAGFFAGFAAVNEAPALAFAVGVGVVLLACYPGRTLLGYLPPLVLLGAAYFGANYLALGQWQPAYSEIGGPWYQYEGSHWRAPNPGEMRPGIDFARYKESKWQYAFHVLFGHHGWFALAPIWLLALVGMVKASYAPTTTLPRFLAPLVFIVSVVVFAFYIYWRDEGNYGGWTNGLRWLMWLTPLWLVFLVPIADRLAPSRLGRGLGYACLAVSIISAHYSPWNPWRHPWLYDLMLSCGWPGY